VELAACFGGLTRFVQGMAGRRTVNVPRVGEKRNALSLVVGGRVAEARHTLACVWGEAAQPCPMG